MPNLRIISSISAFSFSFSSRPDRRLCRPGEGRRLPYLIEVMSPERVIEQLVLVNRPEEVPVEERHVISEILCRQRLEIHLQALGGALLLRQRCQGVQVITRRYEKPPVERQRRRDAQVIVFEDGALTVRFHFY